MKYIFLWDIVSKWWRRVIERLLPKYIEKYQPDFVIANSENMSHWKWANPKHLDEMQKIWIDYFTWWDHSFDTKTAIEEFESSSWKTSKRQLRCLNYPKWTVWKWYFIIEDKILLISLMWNAFMKHNLSCPIATLEELFEKLRKERWKEYFDNLEIFVDFHAETTSEKKALWYFLDWIATWVVWSHTHIQTNDTQILKNWTWYITDLWMNWAMESVLWVKTEIIIEMMKTKIPQKFEREEEWKLEFNWVFMESKNWKCEKIELIREII